MNQADYTQCAIYDDCISVCLLDFFARELTKYKTARRHSKTSQHAKMPHLDDAAFFIDKVRARKTAARALTTHVRGGADCLALWIQGEDAHHRGHILRAVRLSCQ